MRRRGDDDKVVKRYGRMSMTKDLTKQRSLAVQPVKGLMLPKQGTFRKMSGGFLLMASFFLPAIFTKDSTVYPFLNGMLFQDIWLQSFLPILYLSGFTSGLVSMIGRFRALGVPKLVLFVHLVVNTLVILGSGVVLFMALLTPNKHDFSLVLIGPALLIWLPIFVQFGLTWMNRKKPFSWKLARVTWIGAIMSLVYFSMAIFTAMYNADQQVGYGMYVSVAAAILIMTGGVQNEERKTYHSL